MKIIFKPNDVRVVDEGLICESWEISPELFYFAGHFPHLPVLPAVAIVDICLALLQAGRPEQTWKLLQVKSAKFIQPLAPSRKVKIVALFKTPDECEVEWSDAESSDVAAQLCLQVGS